MAIHLSLQEREALWLGLERKETLRSMARRLRRSPSTVSRELARHGGRKEYRPSVAEQRAKRWRRRPKVRKLRQRRELARRVEAGLLQRWSPQQISHRLRQERPNDPHWRVSHETIYQSLYVQGRGGLRKELASALRSGRARRRPQGRTSTVGKIRHMVMISERPPDVDDRAIPGHWEGDLLMGKEGKSQIATLVERTTRFVLLVRLPTDRRAETVRRAIQHKIRSLPRELKRSLTWDQGPEMAEHGILHLATGIQVYFCDPHSPWQRGSNENTNGLLRQYFPKGFDFTTLSARRMNAVARELNGRPRQTLGWMTPAEKFAQLCQTVASTA